MRWSWRRRPPTAPPPEGAAGAPRPAVSGWAFVAPLQRTLGEIEPTTRPADFPPSLAAWSSPRFLGEMGHAIDPRAPGGLVDGDGRGALADLPLASPGAPVSRSLADAPDLTLRSPEPPPAVVQRTTAGSLTRVTSRTAGLPVRQLEALPAPPDGAAPLAPPASAPAGPSPETPSSPAAESSPTLAHARVDGAGIVVDIPPTAPPHMPAPPAPSGRPAHLGLGAPLPSDGAPAELPLQRTAVVPPPPDGAAPRSDEARPGGGESRATAGTVPAGATAPNAAVLPARTTPAPDAEAPHVQRATTDHIDTAGSRPTLANSTSAAAEPLSGGSQSTPRPSGPDGPEAAEPVPAGRAQTGSLDLTTPPPAAPVHASGAGRAGVQRTAAAGPADTTDVVDAPTTAGTTGATPRSAATSGPLFGAPSSLGPTAEVPSDREAQGRPLSRTVAPSPAREDAPSALTLRSAAAPSASQGSGATVSGTTVARSTAVGPTAPASPRPASPPSDAGGAGVVQRAAAEPARASTGAPHTAHDLARAPSVSRSSSPSSAPGAPAAGDGPRTTDPAAVAPVLAARSADPRTGTDPTPTPPARQTPSTDAGVPPSPAVLAAPRAGREPRGSQAVLPVASHVIRAADGEPVVARALANGSAPSPTPAPATGTGAGAGSSARTMPEGGTEPTSGAVDVTTTATSPVRSVADDAGRGTTHPRAPLDLLRATPRPDVPQPTTGPGLSVSRSTPTTPTTPHGSSAGSRSSSPSVPVARATVQRTRAGASSSISGLPAARRPAPQRAPLALRTPPTPPTPAPEDTVPFPAAARATSARPDPTPTAPEALVLAAPSGTDVQRAVRPQVVTGAPARAVAGTAPHAPALPITATPISSTTSVQRLGWHLPTRRKDPGRRGTGAGVVASHRGAAPSSAGRSVAPLDLTLPAPPPQPAAPPAATAPPTTHAVVPPPAPPAATTVATPATAAPSAPSVPSVPDDVELDALARRLEEPLLRRVRDELLLDRERLGFRADRGWEW